MAFSFKKMVPLVMLSGLSSNAFAVFIDGTGEYSLRGSTITKPGFNNESGVYQTVDQFFKLETEIRASDKSSFIFDFRLSNRDEEFHLGDTSDPYDCPKDSLDDSGNPVNGSNLGRNRDCTGKSQNPLEPRYLQYSPKINQAYALYSTDYCLIKAGRRSRHWGLGAFMHDGRDKFNSDSSVYDGVTCDINIQKSQTLGFSVGFDKLAETGSSVFATGSSSSSFGSTNKSDDLSQIFFTIEYKDSATVASGPSQQIGIYFANIFGEANTDIKIADLYLNLAMSDLVLQSEVLFRLGETSSPHAVSLGGVRNRDADEDIRNNMQSIAAAASLEYYISKSGHRPLNGFNRGEYSSHSLFLDFAFTPGDADGYFLEHDSATGDSPRQNYNVKAVAFHRNYNPALLMFNGRNASDLLRVDGVFDPQRLMNTSVFSLGYRYRSTNNGSFEAKVITASLNETIPDEAKSYYTDNSLTPERPVGFYGKDLGTELDLSYSFLVDSGLEVGLSGAIAQGGKAWKTSPTQDVPMNYLLQSHLSFSF